MFELVAVALPAAEFDIDTGMTNVRAIIATAIGIALLAVSFVLIWRGRKGNLSAVVTGVVCTVVALIPMGIAVNLGITDTIGTMFDIFRAG